MNFKKIPNEDKQHLNPEAQRGDTSILLNGRVYRCDISADRFTFARWERVTPWRHPVLYTRIRHSAWKAWK